MLRIVLDSVILVRALIDPRSFCGQIVFRHYGLYRLFVSDAVLREILEVVQRPELTRKFHNLDGLDVRRVIQIVGEAELIEVPEAPTVSRDPGDDKFLALAARSAADYLVTEDKDLLVLNHYEGARILRCSEFLDVLSAA